MLSMYCLNLLPWVCTNLISKKKKKVYGQDYEETLHSTWIAINSWGRRFGKIYINGH